MDTLSLLLILGLIGWFWFDNLRAREAAMLISRKMCQQFQLQLLDDTVRLTKLSIARDQRGRLKLQRHYCFDFSGDSEQRQQGFLQLNGVQLKMIDVPGYVNRTIMV